MMFGSRLFAYGSIAVTNTVLFLPLQRSIRQALSLLAIAVALAVALRDKAAVQRETEHKISLCTPMIRFYYLC